MTSGNANANENANKDQLIALYKQAFEHLKQQFDQLTQQFEEQHETSERNFMRYAEQLIALEAEHKAEKEQLRQLVRTDEVKTALIKQLMQKD